jgi:4-amino-4-deoxy-L-arabinose transferase-like glycosyltransferase
VTSTNLDADRTETRPPRAEAPARRPRRARRALGAVSHTLRRVPRAGWACFLVAFVNAAIWTVVVPPFQVPDEITHFAYAQYLAETGKPPPQRATPQFSSQEQVALNALLFFSVIGHPDQRGILTPAEDATLRSALAQHPSPVGTGGVTNVTNQPPLYYALEAIPYWLSPSSDILTRLELMRLLSALMAAATVLAVFMFMRELFPRSPWSWTAGALVVAFQPMVNFIAAGVQGDNLLYLASALTFWVLIRAYRRGLDRRRAVAIGLVVAMGLLAKLTYIAFLPGIGLALLLLAYRTLPEGRRRAAEVLVLSILTAAVPVALYAVLNVTAWHRGTPLAGGLAVATTTKVASGQVVTMKQSLDYIWELFLPRLPFMHHSYFPGYPAGYIWSDGTVGRFGWLDYGFPAWVYTVGRYVFGALAVMALIGLFRLRHRIRAVWPMFACFFVMAIGLFGAIGYAGIRYRLSTGYQFEQARYLFPLLSLYAVALVLAARAPSRRWAPVLAAMIVLLAMAHGLFAETLTISRYYG